MAADALFLDSNGWVALLNERDELHSRAQILWRETVGEQRPVVFTDWIVAETGNGLARTRARGQFIDSVRQMLRSPRVRVVAVHADLMQRAIELYAERSDKAWGLVDCASFVVMRDEAIAESFTTDRHFEQAGFNCLLPVGIA